MESLEGEFLEGVASTDGSMGSSDNGMGSLDEGVELLEGDTKSFEVREGAVLVISFSYNKN